MVPKMGTSQKKELEVSHKINNKKICYLRKHERNTTTQTLTFSQYKCKQSNVMGLSKEGSVNVSQPFECERSMKLSWSDSELDVKRVPNHSEEIFSVISDASHKPSNVSEILLCESGNEFGSCENKEERYLLDSVEEQELLLSNLTLNAPISFTNIGGSSNLLNLLNYFPLNDPVICSRKKLLVLDINGILADIVYPPPKGCKADTKIAGRAVFTRPFCSDFLKFCFDRFYVAIWSSRSRKIIDRLTNYLLGDMKQKLVFCWDLSHCTESNFRTLENKHKILVFKELGKVWEGFEADLPWKKGYFNESNTLLLDDTPYKALLNPPHTAIFPYSYVFNDQSDNALGPNGNIRAYLEEIAGADDVRKFIEQHPFGQSAITERSMSWRFYHKVLQGHSAVLTGG